MRPGWNPTRRNRNIGTAKQGHGLDNKLVIPQAWNEERIYYERLVNPVAVDRTVNSHTLTFIVEPCLSDFVHACTIDDICRVLQRLPVTHVKGIDLIILRQPKRKEKILCPVWGRLVYWAETGRHEGMAIYLESQSPTEIWRWGKSLQPDGQRELNRLREDGHSVHLTKRHYEITLSLESVRATQLYRTLPHEVGHYADYLTSYLRPSTETDSTDEVERLQEAYRNKPRQEREAFAHRYADEFRSKLESDGHIPFERILDKRKISSEGMDLEWFLN